MSAVKPITCEECETEVDPEAFPSEIYNCIECGYGYCEKCLDDHECVERVNGYNQ